MQIKKKALYGLWQVPWAWYEKIYSYLEEVGFQQGTCNYNLYAKFL